MAYVAHRAARDKIADLRFVQGWGWIASDPDLAESVRRRLTRGHGVFALVSLLPLAWLGATKEWQTQDWALTPATWAALVYLVVLFAAAWEVGRVQQLADRRRSRLSSGESGD